MSCALGYSITFLHGIVLSWLSFFLPVYFQILLESTPLQSGVKLLAVVIPLAPAGMAGGIAIAVTGHYKMRSAAWAFARSFGAIWGAAIPSAVFNSRFDELLHLIPEPSVRDLLAHGGAYEHAIRVFIKQFDAQPVLKEVIIHVYTEALKRVWTVLIPFAVVPIGLALFMKEVELR
ncbi:hypothetical protein COL940_009120 [Colletotrichum noveboracense]|nr:hypothetical protein COL940_009120 [Colletotrichum noveboracense]